MSKFDDEIISGSILRSVWKVAWPVVITQLVAGVGGIIDTYLVGKYVDYYAQAAVGVSWQLFLVILVFLSSFFHGMNIMVARYSGRRDNEAVNRVFFETLKASLYALVFIVAPLGYFLAPLLLKTFTSPDVHVHALPLLRVLFTASLPLFIMFVLNGAFQSSGNPKIPLYFGIITTICKVVLSTVLIAGMGPIPALGVTGAALGTCLAPVPSVLIAIYLVHKQSVIIGIPKEWSLKLDMGIIWPITKLGVPAGIQAVALNVGGAILLLFINSLENSAEAQAAYVVCYSTMFSCVTWAGFGLRAACATVIGQNIGAGQMERGEKAVYLGVALGGLWAAFFGSFYFLFPRTLLEIFSITHSETSGDMDLVIGYSVQLLKYLTFSGVFVVMSLAFTGGLQGAGDTKRPMVIAFISQLGVLLGICVVFYSMDRLTTTIVWRAILVSHLTRLAMSYFVFAKGKWRDIIVEIEEKRSEETAEA